MDACKTLISALERVREPRLFLTERGYQGQLATELDRLLDTQPEGIERPLVEQEYQKRAKVHGIRLRPDIIVHVPFERGVSPTRSHDNHLVIMLKLKANKKRADEDFAKLTTICSKLGYSVGAFVNISTSDLWLPTYPAPDGSTFSLYEFAVTLERGVVGVKTFPGPTI